MMSISRLAACIDKREVIGYVATYLRHDTLYTSTSWHLSTSLCILEAFAYDCVPAAIIIIGISWPAYSSEASVYQCPNKYFGAGSVLPLLRTSSSLHPNFSSESEFGGLAYHLTTLLSTLAASTIARSCESTCTLISPSSLIMLARCQTKKHMATRLPDLQTKAYR